MGEAGRLEARAVQLPDLAHHKRTKERNERGPQSTKLWSEHSVLKQRKV